MSATVIEIPLANLALALIPVGLLVALIYRWTDQAPQALYAISRMLLQLILIGYVLTYLFGADSSPLVIGILCVMLGAAGWIAIRPLAQRNAKLMYHALFAIGLSSSATLLLITVWVLGVEPWYEPRTVIPLGGMILASAMNTVSLAAERFAAEQTRGSSPFDARRTAFQAALIPLLNSLFAVGLVSLPGMMTGQVLSGVDPLIAVRYQIMVMCMLTGAAGIAAAVYLKLQTPGAAHTD